MCVCTCVCEQAAAHWGIINMQMRCVIGDTMCLYFMAEEKDANLMVCL